MMKNSIRIHSLSYFILSAALGALSLPDFASAALIPCDDNPLPPESYYNGADMAGGFSSGGVLFSNSYDSEWGSWSGFAYSNVTDNETPGYENQYAAYPGGGCGPGGAPVPGEIYAVGYYSAFGAPPAIALPAELSRPVSVRVANTAYAALDMRDGSGFSKQFGGPEGTDPDWFILTITGYSGETATGTVEFHLADFTAENPADDYIADSWELLDLTPLGDAVERIEFSLASSDTGEYGMNTPAYFALDNLVCVGPAAAEPSALWGDPLAGECKRAGLGWIYDEAYPFIYLFGENAYAWVWPESGWHNVYLWIYSSGGFWTWTGEELRGWHYNFSGPRSGWQCWDVF